jgi:hypothetical protein
MTNNVKDKIFYDSDPEKIWFIKRSKENDHKWIMFDQPIMGNFDLESYEYVSIYTWNIDFKTLSN